MNKRERFLTIIVGLLVMLVVSFFVSEKVRAAFRRRAQMRLQVQSELDRKQGIIDRGAKAARELASYEEISLPSDAELARSQYQAWLSEIVDRVGLKEPQVKVVSQSQLVNDCTQLSCSIIGRGDLRQLAKLLHEFYSVKTIHRIRRLPLRPVPDSKDLTIELRVEALIMATAPSDKTFDISPLSELAQLPIDQVIGPIVERNMFAPANRIPEFERVGSRTIERGDSFSLELAARDPDALDILSFEICAGAPDDLRLDTRSGRLTWRPREVGKYEVKVVVRDDGIPVRTAEQTIEFEVVDPPPPPEVAENTVEEPQPLKFDDARYTYAIAMVEVSGERQLWLQVRTSGKILKLSEGDPVRIGSIDAKIAHIGDREVELEADGTTFRIQVGEPLVGTD